MFNANAKKILGRLLDGRWLYMYACMYVCVCVFVLRMCESEKDSP